MSFTVIAELEKALADTHALAAATLKLIAPDLALSRDESRIDGSQLAPEYGIPTDATMEALRLVARTEALLLDPVCSGKAFARMLSAVKDGAVPEDRDVLS